MSTLLNILLSYDDLSAVENDLDDTVETDVFLLNNLKNDPLVIDLGKGSETAPTRFIILNLEYNNSCKDILDRLHDLDVAFGINY